MSAVAGAETQVDRVFDLRTGSVRELNQALHDLPAQGAAVRWRVVGAQGEHAVAVGIDAPVELEIEGHVGYYCGGMNKRASLVIHGNAATGLAENMMSGSVRLRGSASQSAGATGRGGLLVIEGDASARCGISMKGIDIVVQGSVGHLSAFMAQKGRLVVCGDAGPGLGDSIYEAELYVRGRVADLGADCEEKPMEESHKEALAALLDAARVPARAGDFRRYGSARRLYHFHVDHADRY